jgi:hypothetical protein
MSPELEAIPGAPAFGARVYRHLAAPLTAALLAVSACQPQPVQAPGAIPASAPRADSVLEAWLSQHPAVAGAIVWETERGPVPWAGWDEARRRTLEEAFLAARATIQGGGDPLGFPLRDPPPNVADAASHERTVLSAGDAFRLYVAHVGHSLAVEILRAVPWSLANDAPEVLSTLLDGRRMFVWKGELGGYLLDGKRVGWVVPAPPAVELGFLTREHLLGATRLATIEALVGWSHQLRHVRGRLDVENGERVWQYRGMAPVSRVLASTGPGAHVTAGCWGTTGMLISVLRAANIPVQLANVRAQGRAGHSCSHAQPYFVSEGRYLSHGDDPYNRMILTPSEGGLPPGRLLVDQATWTSWYGESVDPVSRCANIGRQVREIALETLPPYLVDAFCEDQRSGVDHASGRVARALTTHMAGTAFPVSRLEHERLWERLAERAHSTGACSKAPSVPPGQDPAEPLDEL